MNKCLCGDVPKKGDHYCRNCGKKQEQLLDSFLCECGAEVFETDCFCHVCGVKFDGIEEEEEFLNTKQSCNTCGNDF